MNPELMEDILEYLQDDVTLQSLVPGGVKIAYAVLPPTFPSVTLRLDRDVSEPRAGHDYSGYSDHDATLGAHSWTKDEGQIINTVPIDANSLQLMIADRVRVLFEYIDMTIPWIREPVYSSTPLPFEDDTHVHHTAGTLKFVYTTVDTP